MDVKVLFVLLVFLVLFGFYAINLFLPNLKRLKYWIALTFSFIGLSGWTYVWLGYGWLLTGIVSSGFLLLSALSVIISLGLDFVTTKKL